MKKLCAVVSVLFCLLLLVSCNSSAQQHTVKGTVQAEYRKISPEQAQEILKENQNAILVDVRTQPEYEEQRIPQSILIPNEEISSLAPKLLADKHAVILVYCRTGVRSKDAALKLVELGYTSVYDIGGITNWPYQTVSGK